MSFALFLIYLVLSFVRPWELSPALQSLPIIGVASGAAMAATLISIFLGRGPTARAPQPYLALLFAGWVLLSFIAATGWLGGLPDVVSSLQPSLLVFFLVFLNVDTISRLRTTAGTLVLIMLFLVGQCAFAYHFGYKSSVFLLLEFAADNAAWEGSTTDAPASDAPEGAVVRVRSVGSLADPNDLAQALVTVVTLLIALRRPGRRVWNNLLVWAPAVVILYGILLTRSRGALIALLAVCFFAFRQRLGRALSAMMAGTLALALIAIGFTGGRTLSGDESSNSRIESWYQGMQMLKSSPIWGVGFGNYRETSNLVAHNSYVHCFSETGLVGYFLWLWLIAITLAEVLALSKRGDEGSESSEIASWGRALHLAFVGFLIAAFFLSRTYSPVLFLILGLGTALSDMARRGGHPADSTSLVGWIPRVVGLEAASVLVVWLCVFGMG